jgi:hypothetical protein
MNTRDTDAGATRGYVLLSQKELSYVNGIKDPEWRYWNAKAVADGLSKLDASRPSKADPLESVSPKKMVARGQMIARALAAGDAAAGDNQERTVVRGLLDGMTAALDGIEALEASHPGLFRKTFKQISRLATP